MTDTLIWRSSDEREDRRRAVRRFGAAAAAIIGLYVGAQVALTYAGRGYAWGSLSGYESSYGSPGVNPGLRLGLTLGPYLGRRHKGEVVHVDYDATIRSGCIEVQLRGWGDAFSAYVPPLKIKASGKGEASLTIPADGFWQVSVRGYGGQWCDGIRRPGLQFMNPDEAFDLDYRLRWRV
jgi:hypothetical protein